ncbi:MAG: STM4012 family radical SAM protein [Planctomycetota bacterium]
MPNTSKVTHPLLDGSPYQSYVYGYPHKTTYRPFETPLPLRDLWQAEDRSSLFLYLHVPFCEMRCGFCNLFTTVDKRSNRTSDYLDALERHIREVSDALGQAVFARMAIGGGTPTYLGVKDLERLLDLARDVLGADCAAIPTSVETSPGTASPEKLSLLRERGVSRVSIGVQSFSEEDAKRIGRPMRREILLPALKRIRDLDFPSFNIDLIYGGEGQTPERWLDSVKEAIDVGPQEIYIYPLYIRPLTTLGRRDRHWDDQRIQSYRLAREYLQDVGYRQISMRMFQRSGAAASDEPHYCCQRDGMVGLGCGARSYTDSVHYSTEYAVGRSGVQSIIDSYIARTGSSFGFADHGIRIDHHEKARRYLLLSLLQSRGLKVSDFRKRFECDIFDTFPKMRELEELQLMERIGDCLRLTAAGIERSDAIGPWLYSSRVIDRIEGYEWH